MEKENEIQSANEVKVLCLEADDYKSGSRLDVYSWHTMNLCSHVFRRLWRSRSSLTERPIRSRSVAWETSWKTKKRLSLSCKSKTTDYQMLYHSAGASEPVLILWVLLVQFEPEGHSGAGEAKTGAWEAEGCWPGEEPPAARAHVRPGVKSEKKKSHCCVYMLLLTPISCVAECCRTDGNRPSRTSKDWRRLWSVICMII